MKREELLRPTRTVKPPRAMGAIELRLRMRDGEAPTLVDVREAGPYHARHIAGSIHAPDSQTTSLVRKLQTLKSALLVCDDGKGSSMATRTLGFCGFQDIAYLEGGLEAWVKAGGTLVETTRSGFEHELSIEAETMNTEPGTTERGVPLCASPGGRQGGGFFRSWFAALGSWFGYLFSIR